MKLTLSLLILSSVLPAQTTLRLRTGGPQSTYLVESAAGVPATLSVKSMAGQQRTHDLADGDTIHIQFAPGCVELNGYRKVVNASGATGTLQVTDLSGKPIACETPLDAQFRSAVLGKVKEYTLRATHPRMLIPSEGEVYERMKDPDGTGPRVAPVAAENGPAWQALVNYTANLIDATPGCDGVDPATCPTIAAAGSGGFNAGVFPLAMAMVWMADNSKTAHLQTARYIVNHWEHGSLTGLGAPLRNFFCDVDSNYCGHSSGVDYISEYFSWAAAAYDIVHDTLTPAQRQAFAEKIMRGWKGDASGCTQPGTVLPGTVTVAQGSKTLTGTGTNFTALAAGQFLFLRTGASRASGTTFTIASIQSDTELTANQGASVASTDGKLIQVRDHWEPGDCGAIFAAAGHAAYLHAVSKHWLYRTSGPMTTADTSVRLTHVAGLPAPPFMLTVETEIMRVTGVSGTTLTVERGMYGAPYAVAAHGSGAWAAYSAHQANIRNDQTKNYYPFTVAGSWSDNVSYQKLHGFLVMSMMLADESEDARELAEETWNFYYNFTYPNLSDYWTGVGQGGVEKGYSLGRWLVNHIWAGTLGANAFTEPNPIFGNYSFRSLLSTPYTGMPDNPRRAITYGSGNIMDANSVSWLPVFAYYAGPSRVEREYANYWFKNVGQYFSNTGLYGSSNVKGAIMTAPYLLPSIPERDYRAELPPWRAFRDTDIDILPGSGKGLWISKSSWGSDASTVVANLQYFDVSDGHDQDYFYTPGHYMVTKGGEYLLGTDTSYGFWAGNSANSNHFEIGGSMATVRGSKYPQWVQPAPADCEGGQQNRLDWTGGTTEYTHARGNFAGTFCGAVGVTRAQRHVIHLKGAVEYVVVHDNFATATPKQHRTRLVYYRYDEPSSVPVRTGNSIVFTKSAGRVSTQLLFPPAAEPSITESGSGSGYRYTLDWGNRTSAQAIAVHRVSASTTDAMPPVRLLGGTDDSTTGFETDDGAESRVVALPKDGTLRAAAAYRTTHAGVGKHLVLGLEAGSYRVAMDGVEVAGSPMAVAGGDGSLAFGGAAGSYGITKLGAPIPILNAAPASIQFDFLPGQASAPDQTVTLDCGGEECVIAAESECAWLTVTPASGPSPQTFVLRAGSAGLGGGEHACEARFSAVAMNSPLSVPVTARVPMEFRPLKAALPAGAVGQPYSVQLMASGGVPPYAWTISSGALPPGLTLSAGGLLAGVPLMEQTGALGIRLTDSGGSPQEYMASAPIQIGPDPIPGNLQVRVLGSDSTRGWIWYGKRGLSRGSSCELALSAEGRFSTLLTQMGDGGGLARRTALVGGPGILAPNEEYYVRVTCAGQVRVTSMRTKPAAVPGERTVLLRLTPPVGLGVDRVEVEYRGVGADWVRATGVCSGACIVRLRLPFGTLFEWRQEYYAEAIPLRQWAPRTGSVE